MQAPHAIRPTICTIRTCATGDRTRGRRPQVPSWVRPRGGGRTTLPSMHGWQRLHALGRRHHGAVAIAHAAAAGLSRSTLRRRAQAEGWPQPFPSVWILPGVTVTRTTMLHAALLSVGTPTALSHDTAASMLGLTRIRNPRPEPGGPIHVVTPVARAVDARSGMVMHRTRHWPEDLAVVEGLACMPAARTVVDIAAGLSRGRAEAMLLSARQRHICSPDEVMREVARRPQLPGTRLLRSAIAVVTDDPVESILERRTLELLRRHRLDPVCQHPVPCPDGRTRHLDLAFPEARVGIECDGRAHHTGADAFERDRERWRQLQAAGWLLTWVTWRQVQDRPGHVVREVSRLLARR